MGPHAEVEVKWLWETYLNWCGQEGRLPAFKAPQWFSRNLVARDGVDSRRGIGGRRSLIGIMLIGDPDNEANEANTPFSATLFENTPIEKDYKKAEIASFASSESVDDDPDFVECSDIWEQEQ